MLEQQRLSNDVTSTTWQQGSGDRRNEMNNYGDQRIHEALRRARALDEAGADALLVTYLTDRTEVERAVRTLRKPLLVVVTESARKSFRADELAGIELAAVIYPFSSLMCRSLPNTLCSQTCARRGTSKPSSTE
jgi:2-methylisocitrate lyase-like PEP mutase family enzyme